MALIVEDGSGLTNAESYASVAEFKDYADKVGHDYTGYTDTKIEQALRRATTWLDARYARSFKGEQTKTDQALQWPRTGVWYRLFSVGAFTIPDKLKNALCEAAWRELVTPQSLSPDRTENVKRDRVGDVETEFRSQAVGLAPSFPAVDSLLVDLVMDRSAYVGRAVRA